MRRRTIGMGGFSLLLGAALAFAAAASDVEREMPEAAESGMEVEPPAEGAAAPEPAPAQAPSAAAGPGDPGWVERATFTTAVVDREPTDSIDTLTTDHLEISFWSDLRALAGQTVIHRWEYAGEVAAEVPFEVGATRWRVHSTKRLDPIETGTWRVSVVDASGRVLESSSFEYRAAAAAPQLGQGAPPEVTPETPPAAPQP